VRIIFSVVIAFIGGLLVFDREYLSPFVSLNGLAVGLAAIAMFATSLIWLMKIAQVATPTRLFRALEKSAS
jgi:hypothetical protein